MALCKKEKGGTDGQHNNHDSSNFNICWFVCNVLFSFENTEKKLILD